MFGKKEETGRFITVSESRLSGNRFLEFITVVKDKETGVLYCIADKANGVSMTPLLDASGNPMVEPVE